MLKDKILKFRRLYEEMSKEAQKIIDNIKPEIGDVQTIHSLTEGRDFYWKHDLIKIKKLGKKYGVNTLRLEEMWRKYSRLKKDISEEFEKMIIGPKSIRGEGIVININKEGLEIIFEDDRLKKNKVFNKLISFLYHDNDKV